MRPGFTPVDRHAGVICHNDACSMQDDRTNVCRISMAVCSDRMKTTENTEERR